MFWKPETNKSVLKTAQPQLDHIPQPSLSKGVMGMKFMMKKSQLSEKQLPEDRLVITKSIEALGNIEWSNCSTSNGKNGSISSCDVFDLYSSLPGRRSFGGCNQAVEMYYKRVIGDPNKFLESKADPGVSTAPKSEVDIIKSYRKMSGLPRGPNQGMLDVSSGRNPKPSVGMRSKSGYHGNMKRKGNADTAKSSRNVRQKI